MIRIVQLGSRRSRGEGIRLGTVRRPPRGVRRKDYGRLNWFDVWLPNVAPTAELMKRTLIREDGAGWATFAKRYRTELKKPESARILDALAALSHVANFSMGCYCGDEAHCHRSLLREALSERGAAVR